MTNKDRDFVVALARGLEVLDCFKPGDNALGNKEIAERTGLPRATVSRLTHTLTMLGYLRRHVESSRYELGSAVLSIGYPLLANMKIRQIARPLMQALANMVNGSVSAGIRDRTNIVYVETCRANEELRRSPDIGSHAPIALSSVGRGWLAAARSDERDAIVRQIRHETPAIWKSAHTEVERGLRNFPKLGYIASFGEVDRSTWAVAVPMRRKPGEEILVFNCAAPAARIDRRYVETVMGPGLIAMVKALEDAIEPAHKRRIR
ncbi:MAG: IclR family transcriptional regulator [Paraburkholderia sp.]|jgi:DNA-binding IclR family transcriptional regulator|nr:IclR family transcriptional regulator [Paraburkholderia sp.]